MAVVTELRLRRIKTGKTLRAFAREHGFSEGMLTRIERGQSYIPPAWRERLAQALGVEETEILDPETGWPRLAS